jgi:hypothetical protein
VAAAVALTTKELYQHTAVEEAAVEDHKMLNQRKRNRGCLVLQIQVVVVVVEPITELLEVQVLLLFVIKI